MVQKCCISWPVIIFISEGKRDYGTNEAGETGDSGESGEYEDSGESGDSGNFESSGVSGESWESGDFEDSGDSGESDEESNSSVSKRSEIPTESKSGNNKVFLRGTYLIRSHQKFQIVLWTLICDTLLVLSGIL